MILSKQIIMSKETEKQATHDAQKEMQSLIDGIKTDLVLSTGRKIKIGYICADAQDKIDTIVVHHDDIAKRVEKGDIQLQIGNKYANSTPK